LLLPLLRLLLLLPPLLPLRWLQLWVLLEESLVHHSAHQGLELLSLWRLLLLLLLLRWPARLLARVRLTLLVYLLRPPAPPPATLVFRHLPHIRRPLGTAHHVSPRLRRQGLACRHL